MTRIFTACLAIGTAALLSVPAIAGVSSPSDRNLRKILVGAETSCDMPIYIAGTRGTLGGETGACGDASVETLSFRRNADVHVKLVSEDELARIEGRQCVDFYKYTPPGTVTQYNVRTPGPFTFKTSTLCVRTDNPVASRIRLRNTSFDGSASYTVRTGL